MKTGIASGLLIACIQSNAHPPMGRSPNQTITTNEFHIDSCSVMLMSYVCSKKLEVHPAV